MSAGDLLFMLPAEHVWGEGVSLETITFLFTQNKDFLDAAEVV